jgi:hypothetical protein
MTIGLQVWRFMCATVAGVSYGVRKARLDWATLAPPSPCDMCLAPTMDYYIVYPERLVVRRCDACQRAYVKMWVEMATKKNPWENI